MSTASATVSGSSPLARGTPECVFTPRLLVGIIPARAGNTTCRPALDRPRPDHPRSRGEHLSAVNRQEIAPGSSPLARGTLRKGDRVACAFRIIPARAGNTVTHYLAAPGSPDHPRSRGEHRQPWKLTELDAGSSPLARGTRVVFADVRPSRGIIPARAGNTFEISTGDTPQ